MDTTGIELIIIFLSVGISVCIMVSGNWISNAIEKLTAEIKKLNSDEDEN